MRVVTGQADTPTPDLQRSEMTTSSSAPTGTCPPNIARDETLPAVLRDRGYLRRKNMEVVRGGQVVDPRRIGDRAAAGHPVPPAARAGQFARPREVPLPEPVQRLPARHARATRSSRARGAPSATAACAWRSRRRWRAGSSRRRRLGRRRAIAAAMRAGRESARGAARSRSPSRSATSRSGWTTTARCSSRPTSIGTTSRSASCCPVPQPVTMIGPRPVLGARKARYNPRP